jgi:hypothetical protein
MLSNCDPPTIPLILSAEIFVSLMLSFSYNV